MPKARRTRPDAGRPVIISGDAAVDAALSSLGQVLAEIACNSEDSKPDPTEGGDNLARADGEPEEDDGRG